MFFYGLSQTFAVNATLIAHLQPLFVSVFGAYFLNERLDQDDYVGGALILLSALLITSRTLPDLLSLRIGNFGDLMVSVATLSWAIVTVPGKKLTRETSSSVITGLRFLISATIFISALFVLNELVLRSVYQILIGVLVGLGSIFYYESLKRIKANRVALVELSSPFVAAILAWYILGEIVTVMQILGAMILVTGFYMLTRDRGYAPPR
jgi:drug/metabolite transporter (DMT)-like permease